MVADVHHTPRWSQRALSADVTYCKVDVAFACTDSSIADRLYRWTDANDSDAPRSVEDLTEVEFADVMKDIAEENHLDKACAHAFTGSIGVRSECMENESTSPSSPIDAIEQARDETQGFDATAAADDEADLLDAMPLPGFPQNETERRKL